MKKQYSAAAGVACAALLFSACPAMAGSGGKGNGPNSSDIVPVGLSSDSGYLLATDGFQNGLKLVDTASGKATIISRGSNAGVYASLSADGKYVCYKAFDEGGTGQIPMLYDIAAKKNIALNAAAPLAGTPAVGGGLTAYTLGNELIILNADGTVRATYDLGHHVNLVSISSDGASVAYNDANHQIVVIDLASGATNVVTDGSGDFWGPQFSPAGDKVLATSAGGSIVAGSKSGKAKQVGKGQNAGWIDNNTVGFAQKAVRVGEVVLSTDVVAADVASGKSAKLVSHPGDANAAVSGGKALLSEVGSKAVKVGHGSGASEVAVPDAGDEIAAASVSGDVTATADLVDTTGYKYLSNMKYIHQNNDTPDYWNGNSSCNAVAAIMAMQYYNILPKHPMTSSWPTPHNSDYGWYVPEKYSFNGYSYSTYTSTDPNGRTGWGGFGHITRNGWYDTKTYMRDYIVQHGPSSGSVDWSPTYADAKNQIDANRPFVLLNSLTTAGHYIVTTGYYKSQYTLIFHDPYGNKNSGSYPSDNGRDVRYDWPGYNNGYKSLVTVHCYIYCIFTPPSAPSALAATTVSSSQINLSWTDNSSCEEFNDVYRSTSATSGFTKIASLGPNVKTYSSTGLAAGTTYYYYVKARTPAGSSAASNTVNKATSGAVATIIVDNSNGGFTASSNWSTGTSAADKYGTNYRFRTTAATSDAAQWSFNITSTQNYAISAWWSQGTNRSATAPYIMPNGATVNKNQQANGGSWQALGTQSLATGTRTVKLSCWTTTGYIVLADAIKVVPQ